MPWDGFSLRRKKEMPQGLFIKCPGCEKMVYRKSVGELLQVCPECNYHYTLGAPERIQLLLDEGSFVELDPFVVHQETNFAMGERRVLGDGVVTGLGRMDGRPVAVFSIWGPADRMPPSRFQALGAVAIEAAASVEAALRD